MNQSTSDYRKDLQKVLDVYEVNELPRRYVSSERKTVLELYQIADLEAYVRFRENAVKEELLNYLKNAIELDMARKRAKIPKEQKELLVIIDKYSKSFPELFEQEIEANKREHLNLRKQYRDQLIRFEGRNLALK